MKKIFFLSLTLLLIPAFVWAHPGPVDENDCHFCRKNCDVWSVPWHAIHCHGKNEMTAPQVLKGHSNEDKRQPAKEKQPGWEYRMEIKKISAEGPVNVAPDK